MLGKKTVASYLSAVFVAGLLAGGAAGFCLGKRKAFTPPRTQDMATHMCDRLKSKLHLSPEQEKRIEPLVKEAATELESVFCSTAERMTEVFRRLNERQKQFLTPDQQTLLEELERERQQFFHKAFKPKPGDQPASPPSSPKAN